MRATKKMTKTVSKIQPMVTELADNEYAWKNLRRGADSLREGARALADGRQHPKRHWPKRLAAVGLAGAAAAGAAMAAKGSGSGDGRQ
jgi:ferric-dicitrate binding protein FerR (iron transport regulator)